MSLDDDEEQAGSAGPLFNAPWPAVTVAGAILGSYAWQAIWGGGSAAVTALGFAPADLERGHWYTLLTVLFVHAGWVHALLNAVLALAFGTPVARLLGANARGAAGFFDFFLLCGVLSSLGYAAFHLHSALPIIGASGAVGGLMGGASRLFGREGEGLAPLLSWPVLGLGAGLLVANALIALSTGILIPQGMNLGWEAQITGFLAGVLLIGPAARLFGSR